MNKYFVLVQILGLFLKPPKQMKAWVAKKHEWNLDLYLIQCEKKGTDMICNDFTDNQLFIICARSVHFSRSILHSTRFICNTQIMHKFNYVGTVIYYILDHRVDMKTHFLDKISIARENLLIFSSVSEIIDSLNSFTQLSAIGKLSMPAPDGEWN